MSFAPYAIAGTRRPARSTTSATATVASTHADAMTRPAGSALRREPPALGAFAVACSAPADLQVAQVAEGLAQPPVRVQRRHRLAEHLRDGIERGHRPLPAQHVL